MISPLILIGLVQELADRQMSAFRNALAAVGGFLIGTVAVYLLLLLVFRVVGVKKVPRQLTLGLSMAAGLIVGWLVFVWFSGTAGAGPGPGGGVATQPAGKQTAPHSTVKDTPPDTSREPADTLRIVMVRSKDYERESQRYYLVDGKTPARNLAETLLIVKDRRVLNPKLKTVEVVIYQDSITEEQAPVPELESAIPPLGLEVKRHKPSTTMP
jgi:hypothetical protein